MPDRTVNGGIAFRPYAETEKQTTATPEEHPQYVVYCLNRHKRMVTPPELVDAYIDLYKDDEIDVMMIASIPCNASQLLARELRKEGNREISLIIYGRDEDLSRLVLDLKDRDERAKLIEFLEAHPHHNSIDMIITPPRKTPAEQSSAEVLRGGVIKGCYKSKNEFLKSKH